MTGRSKILIVDDRKENLFALKQTLNEVDVDIITATSGQESLKSTLHHDFALIILDVQMPEMDGYELAELLRGKKETQKIPIIFLSAVHTSSFSLFKGYRTGAVDFLTKPVEPQIIVNKVKSFVSLDQQKHELKAAYDKLQTAQSQLIQSSKMSALGEMATGAAHELNQPLQIISISAETIRMRTDKRTLTDKDWEKIELRLDTIQQMVERASGITNHLRNFGTEERKTHYRAVNIRSAIDQSFLLLRAEFHSLAIEIVIQESDSENTSETPLSESSLQVYGNAFQIGQVLGNLLLNARDALKDAPVKKVTIRSFQKDNHAVIEVEDTGKGIDPEDLDKIFNPFFTTKKTGVGIGLGLSVSHTIIQNHQGKLSVSSTEGSGTTFHITIPILTGDKG